MQNAKSSLDLIQDDHDLQDFQQRAVEHEAQAARSGERVAALQNQVRQNLRALPQRVRKLPNRYLLHVIVLLLLPLGFIVNVDTSRNASADQEGDSTSVASTNPPRPLLGAAVMTHRGDPVPLNDTPPAANTETPAEPVGDAPISDPAFDESLVIPVSRPAAPVRSIPTASINVEKANLRSGPGTQYDQLDKLPQGTNVQVIARHEDWAQVRTEGGQEGWLALELITIDAEAAAQLPAAESIPTPPPARVATIVEDRLNLRDGPGTEYISVNKLSAGMQVNLLAKYNGWYQIQTDDGSVGWVTSDYLNMEPGVDERIEQAETIPDANPAMVAWVNTDNVNLRSGPSTKYESLGKLAGGVELGLLARYNDWIKVETPRGTKGWISLELVDMSNFVLRRVPYTDNIPALPKPKAAPVASPRSSAPAAGGGGGGGVASGDVAGLAWQFVGSRYVWGGESPSGFDCSGLTRYLYRQVGVSLPHSAAGQYSSRYGTFISGLDNLQPGDLLFFVNTAGPGITHVGIYVGSGTMVNAMTPASGVGAVSIYSSYWLNHYYGALRPYR